MDDAWTIEFANRRFDRFRSQQEALHKALEWSRNATDHGHQAIVLLEGSNGEPQEVKPPRWWQAWP